MIVAPVIVMIIEVRAGLAIDTWAGVEIIVVAAIVIALECAVPVSYFSDVLSGMVVGTLIDALAGVIIGFVSSIGVEMLADANVNVFASLMTALEFAVPKPLEEFSC